jgi:predicted CoA-binding protein
MKTLVIGASENPERYSNKAIKKLRRKDHEVKAVGFRSGKVEDVEFTTEHIIYPDIHTVTLYVGPKNQMAYYDYIEKLNPKRVIFNPGTENEAFEEQLRSKGIEVTNACTLVLLSTNQF